MIRSAIQFLDSLLNRKSKSATTILCEKSVCIVETDSPIVCTSKTSENTSMVTVESLGMETLGGVFTPIIPSSTSIPCDVSERFATMADKQTEIHFRLYRGNSEYTRQNHFLGDYMIVGMRPAPRGESQVSVTFLISNQRQVSITAQDTQTDQPVTVRRMR